MKVFKKKFKVVGTVLGIILISILSTFLIQDQNLRQTSQIFKGKDVIANPSLYHEEDSPESLIPKSATDLNGKKEKTAWNNFIISSEVIRKGIKRHRDKCKEFFKEGYPLDQRNADVAFSEKLGEKFFFEAFLNRPRTHVPAIESIVNELVESGEEFDIGQVSEFLNEVRPCQSKYLASYYKRAFEVLPKQQWFRNRSEEDLSYIVADLKSTLTYSTPFNENLEHTINVLRLLNSSGLLPEGFKSETIRFKEKLVSLPNISLESFSERDRESLSIEKFRSNWRSRTDLKRSLLVYLDSVYDRLDIQPIDAD